MRLLIAAFLLLQPPLDSPVVDDAKPFAEKPKFPPPRTTPPPCFHLYMVYFESGSSAISGQGNAVLDNFAYDLVKHDIRSRIVVTASTDTVGTVADNRRLALRRGRAVLKYLEGLGMDPALIEIVPEGENQLLVPTPDETPEPHNRFVNVREEPTPQEMERRRAAWADFPNVVC